MSREADLIQNLHGKLVGVYRVAIRLCLVQCHGTVEERQRHRQTCGVGKIYDLCRSYGIESKVLVSAAFAEREEHSLTESEKIKRCRCEAIQQEERRALQSERSQMEIEWPKT